MDLHIPHSELVVTNRDESMMLNKRLLDQQNCWTNLDLIKSLHEERMEVEYLMSTIDNRNQLIELDGLWDEIQFDLQSAWGFPRNAFYHKFWTVPKCTCPCMDNEDRYPTGYYVMNNSCPIHGK